MVTDMKRKEEALRKVHAAGAGTGYKIQSV